MLFYEIGYVRTRWCQLSISARI